MVLVGLLAAFAVALEATPSEGEQVNVTLRRLSTSEVVSILDKFPEIVPGHLAWVKDRAGLAGLLPLTEVSAAPLEDALPGVRFYKGMDRNTLPPFPYLMAIAGSERYSMPSGFNWMLVDNGLEVNDKNMFEMARAFVILAAGTQHMTDPEAGGYGKAELSSFPQIAFLNATRIAEVRGGISYDAKLKVKIGERTEEWYFDKYFNEFRVVSRGNEQGLILQYDPVFADPPPQRGRRD
jgi:hypothetical protein